MICVSIYWTANFSPIPTPINRCAMNYVRTQKKYVVFAVVVVGNKICQHEYRSVNVAIIALISLSNGS